MIKAICIMPNLSNNNKNNTDSRIVEKTQLYFYSILVNFEIIV